MVADEGRRGGQRDVDHALLTKASDFIFDVAKRRVIPIVGRVNALLEAGKDPWGVASWWTTPSERLNDRCPYELLGSVEEQEIEELASADLEPIG